jgi:hypothetical protein
MINKFLIISHFIKFVKCYSPTPLASDFDNRRLRNRCYGRRRLSKAIIANYTLFSVDPSQYQGIYLDGSQSSPWEKHVVSHAGVK